MAAVRRNRFRRSLPFWRRWWSWCCSTSSLRYRLRLRMIHGTRTSAARWPPSLFRRLFLLTKMTTATAFRCFASSKESADDVTVSGSTGENRLRFRNPRTRTHSHTQTLRHGRTHTHSHTHTHLAGRRAREKPSSFLAFQGILLGLMTVALVATTTFRSGPVPTAIGNTCSVACCDLLRIFLTFFFSALSSTVVGGVEGAALRKSSLLFLI